MEGWTRYIIVAMLSHWKLEKIKTHQKKKSMQTALYIVCHDNGILHPKGFSQVSIWWNIYRFSITSGCPDPIGKEKRPGHF